MEFAASLGDTGSEWPLQDTRNFADIDLMPCVLLSWLLMGEGLRIRIIVVQPGHVSTQATFQTYVVVSA